MQRIFMFILVLTISGFAFSQAKGDNEFFLKYDGLKTFSADFTQVFTSKLTKKVNSEESGKIFYQAPASMRFDYTGKAGMVRQIFLSEKEISIINYEQKLVNKKTGQGDYGQYLVFLKGVQEVKKKFDVKKAEVAAVKKAGIKAEDGQDVYKLTPIQKMPNLRYLFLILKEKEVISAVVIDELSNINQLMFTNVKYDGKIEKSSFEPVIPKGFEISNM